MRRQLAHPTPPDVFLAEYHEQHDQPLMRLVDASTPANLVEQHPAGVQCEIFRRLKGVCGRLGIGLYDRGGLV